MEDAVNEVRFVSGALCARDDQRRERESDEYCAKNSREYHPPRAGWMVSQWECLKDHQKSKGDAPREGEGETAKEHRLRKIVEREGDCDANDPTNDTDDRQAKQTVDLCASVVEEDEESE